MIFQDYFTSRIISIVKNRASQKPDSIFVLPPRCPLIKDDSILKRLVDAETFLVEQLHTICNEEWTAKAFATINQLGHYTVLSYGQFCYLNKSIDDASLQDRVLIIKDNLRQLFLIDQNDFLELNNDENTENRPDNLPVHHSEQLALDNQYYYSVKTPVNKYETEDLFDQTAEIAYTTNAAIECIDISSDQYALEVFINNCVAQNDFNKQLAVRYYSKQPLDNEKQAKLQKLNFILQQFGGQLFLSAEAPINKNCAPKESTQQQLKKYWGDDAEFRNIRVYKNPDAGKEIVEISQGLIVETIIDEYEHSKNGLPTGDLFLTAPTGSGKSLLFQLPAFYISHQGDITIVVSPLIALMKDQVSAIINERNFKKVAYINSELSLTDRDKIIENCISGDIDILYLSPELLLSYDITHFIGSRRLGLLIIDEAHLITTWGRDFRVDYWFLGNHVQKIRKYNNLNFPMVAVTATAIYGGNNDMVFDSIDSLVMHNPYLFIGEVKRNDIEFVLNNYDEFSAKHEANKLKQTVEFIKQINELELKTLVYTPYTKHIRQILDHLAAGDQTIATGYYGSLDSQSKEFSYQQFKSGEKKIMVSTKAFGMGVDIADIQVVYHHAPSGLLPDYVQEIGRVARKPGLQGFAVLNYSSKDQLYTKILHKLSALRQFQIREVLKKIYKSYLKGNENPNLLVSVDDFGYLFRDSPDPGQKVLSALMMIEKDYLARAKFNVIVARPQKLSVSVFARITDEDLVTFNENYPGGYESLKSQDDIYNVIEIDLEKLWKKYFSEKSFPVLKKEFYTGHLFREKRIQLIPQLTISIEILSAFDVIQQKLESILKLIKTILITTDGYFTPEMFQHKIEAVLQNKNQAEKLTEFILSSYSRPVFQSDNIEPGTFLQYRKKGDDKEYRVFGSQYTVAFKALTNRLKSLFGNSDKRLAYRFVTNKEANGTNYMKLGYLLELLELGTFNIKGGEHAMISIRLNDPQRIERDSNDPDYSNSLLSKTLERHELSNELFDHFFLKSFSTEERWDFIEDFFLGADNSTLLQNFEGSEEGNHINIIEHLKNNAQAVESDSTSKPDENESENEDSNIHIFLPQEDRLYAMHDLLTIENETGVRTMRITEWLSKDPVTFDITRKKLNLTTNREVFDILMSKLRVHEFDYFKKMLGLNLHIEFKGYDKPVKAVIPYKDKPVEFYKWWCDHKESIFISFQEKILLFDTVYKKKPVALKSEHKKIIHK